MFCPGKAWTAARVIHGIRYVAWAEITLFANTHFIELVTKIVESSNCTLEQCTEGKLSRATKFSGGDTWNTLHIVGHCVCLEDSI